MITLRRSTVLGFALAALGLLASALFWHALPARMPIHFDASGQANGYGGRMLGALLMPGLIAGMAALFALLPAISPRGFGMRRFGSTVGLVALAIELFLLAVHVALLRAASSGGALSVGFVQLGVGLLLLVIGNQLGKVQRNFFLGIRTPWTLADEEVWLRTHRLAGKLFVLAGLGTVLLLLLPTAPGAWIALVLAASLAPLAYSYLLYRRLHPGERA